MIYMISRYLTILLFITSCSTLKIEDYRAIIAEFASPSEDIKVDKDLYDSKQFSFAKFRIGNDAPVILSLANITDGFYTWVSRDLVKIITKDGKIIRTFGLEYDVEVIDYSDWSLNDGNKSINLLEVQNPHAIFSQHSRIQLQKQNTIFLNKLYKVLYFDERITTDAYRWSETNHYAVDNEVGLVIWSHQHIHPYLESIEISYYYKF
tara:strand:- start:35 stop:655 length:621 start_codon:yes stop_codon:yes gene_type:complete